MIMNYYLLFRYKGQEKIGSEWNNIQEKLAVNCMELNIFETFKMLLGQSSQILRPA